MADARYAPYTKETAMCVDFAYSAVLDDIRAELEHAKAPTEEILRRLLQRIDERRAVMETFLTTTRQLDG